MIDPSRFAEDVANHKTFSKPLPQKSDTEAVEDWEDEGGASTGSGGDTLVDHSLPAPVNEVTKEPTCT
jgi:hypothetical protein